MQKQAVDEFGHAAADRFRKYKSRFQRYLYDGPTAKEDAEDAERSRWIDILASLIRDAPTPMGVLMSTSSHRCRQASFGAALKCQCYATVTQLAVLNHEVV